MMHHEQVFYLKEKIVWNLEHQNESESSSKQNDEAIMFLKITINAEKKCHIEVVFYSKFLKNG